MSETPTPAPCGLCAGKWLYGLTHQHQLDCARYNPETATIAADEQRGHGIRKPSETEKEIIHEHQYEIPGPHDAYYVRFEHGGIPKREVIIGPDDLRPRPGGILFYWEPVCRPAERGAAAGADD